MIEAVLRAAWVVPVLEPPLRDGWVAVGGGRILALGSGTVDAVALDAWMTGPAASGQRRAADPDGARRLEPGEVRGSPADGARSLSSDDARRLSSDGARRLSSDGARRLQPSVREIDLGDVALLPGLVNAHTHLELSGLRGRVPPAPSLPSWVRELLRARAAQPEDPAAILHGLQEAERAGTAALADISNSLLTVDALAGTATRAVVFHEVLGFDSDVADARAETAMARVARLAPAANVRLRLAAHAPYSTSRELIRRVVAMREDGTWPATSIHVAESRAEGELLDAGTGPWRRMLEEMGAWSPAWCPPRRSSVSYLDGLGVWRPGAMAVHCVHATTADLDLLAERDVTVVTCPRSNAWVGEGRPPLERFVSSGVRVAVGTDSLASAPDLSVFGELARLRRLAPDLPARTLLSWATINGATALGLGGDLGAIAPGRRARLLAARMPRGLQDPEERLVAGLTAGEVAWVDAEAATR
jgi:cytosine/adenosine deaminase-related metal-dependent hydrolase